MNLAKAVANAAAMLVLKAKNVAQVAEDTLLQNRVIAAATRCALSTSQLVACTKVRTDGRTGGGGAGGRGADPPVSRSGCLWISGVEGRLKRSFNAASVGAGVSVGSRRV